MSWYKTPCPAPSKEHEEKAKARQLELTKPAGSLGQLEVIAETFSGWQQCITPTLEHIGVRVFAADHGVASQGVSAFPAEVTVQMISNFLSGGAAISVLSQQHKADFAVINMGTLQPTPAAEGLINIDIARGTEDFTTTAAMSHDTLQTCLAAGRDQVDTLNCELFIAGEMGIGNTSSASAITAALLGHPAQAVVGRGTGVNDLTLLKKEQAIARALELHRASFTSPEEVLRCVGGLEIAAMCGAYIRSAQRGIPVLLDGFISTAAALLAVRVNPGVNHWLMAGHQSAEAAHGMLLDALKLTPLLQLGMRLGEGSGAAVALSVVQSALLLHRQMATFSQAGVANA